jgi:hypothetical protein
MVFIRTATRRAFTAPTVVPRDRATLSASSAAATGLRSQASTIRARVSLPSNPSEINLPSMTKLLQASFALLAWIVSLASDLLADSMRKALLQILHLNFECEAKWLSCSHICSLPAQTPHGIPHRSCMQRLAGAFRGRCVQQLNCSLWGVRGGNTVPGGDLEMVVRAQLRA